MTPTWCCCTKCCATKACLEFAGVQIADVPRQYDPDNGGIMNAPPGTHFTHADGSTFAAIMQFPIGRTLFYTRGYTGGVCGVPTGVYRPGGEDGNGEDDSEIDTVSVSVAVVGDSLRVFANVSNDNIGLKIFDGTVPFVDCDTVYEIPNGLTAYTHVDPTTGDDVWDAIGTGGTVTVRFNAEDCDDAVGPCITPPDGGGSTRSSPATSASRARIW